MTRQDVPWEWGDRGPEVVQKLKGDLYNPTSETELHRDVRKLGIGSMLMQKRDAIVRWWLVVQEFDMEVVYRAGRNMQHIDASSRNLVRVRGGHYYKAEALMSGYAAPDIRPFG